MALAKFFHGMSLSLRRDLQEGGSVRDDGESVRDDGDGVRDDEPSHYLQLLAGTCTFRNSSAPGLSAFQFLVLVKWRTVEDEARFLADKRSKHRGVALAAGQ